MIDKSVPGDRAIRYYPIIDTDDTGMHKVALIPTLSDTQLKRDRKPYLEEIVPHIFHLRGGDTIRAEISCPRCGERMEHYIDYNKQATGTRRPLTQSAQRWLMRWRSWRR